MLGKCMQPTLKSLTTHNLGTAGLKYLSLEDLANMVYVTYLAVCILVTFQLDLGLEVVA